MRRTLGAAGVVKQRQRDQRMTEMGAVITENRVQEAKQHIETFRTKLTEFATKYRDRIRQDPQFREEFVKLCESAGVDPLQSTRSSWLQDLFGMGSFYSDLAIKVLTECMIRRKSNFGALLPLNICMQNIQTENVSSDDISRAIASLECFGAGGVKIINIGGTRFISSMPAEIDKDTEIVLSAYDSPEGKSCEEIASRLSWPQQRTQHALSALIKEGVVWIDQVDGATTYWVLSLWLNSK
jgi:ESCRT-II complex subunit VPS22